MRTLVRGCRGVCGGLARDVSLGNTEAELRSCKAKASCLFHQFLMCKKITRLTKCDLSCTGQGTTQYNPRGEGIALWVLEKKLAE